MFYQRATPEDYERIKEIEKEVKAIEEAYAQECFNLYLKPGFDIYNPKWKKKIDKVAQKYADYLAGLQNEHDELLQLVGNHEEEERKKKYVDPS